MTTLTSYGAVEPACQAEILRNMWQANTVGSDLANRIAVALQLATFRRKIEVLGCCGRIAQGMENCKVRRN